MQVIWEDKRIRLKNSTIDQKYSELKIEERHKLWVRIFDELSGAVTDHFSEKGGVNPFFLFGFLLSGARLIHSANSWNESADAVRRNFKFAAVQKQHARVQSWVRFNMKQEIAIYVLLMCYRISNWSLMCCSATIVIKCDMDFVLYPLDVQNCPVDFSSCEYPQIDLWRNQKSK